MAGNTQRTYRNLIDILLSPPEEGVTTEEMFRFILKEYFFNFESRENRSIDAFLEKFGVPPSIAGAPSLMEVDLQALESDIEGESINTSLAGKIFLSEPFLKFLFPNSSPSFSKLQEDDKFEVIGKIKQTNEELLAAFSKIQEDLEAARNRTILTTVALAIKNIHLKTGKPLNTLSEPMKDLISRTFNRTEETFTGETPQVSTLKDDSNVKQIIKTVFPVRQFSEISELSELFKSEIDRYAIRARHVNGQ
jgi:hypothetical protein